MAFRFYELASNVKDFIVTRDNVWLVDNYRPIDSMNWVKIFAICDTLLQN